MKCDESAEREKEEVEDVDEEEEEGEVERVIEEAVGMMDCDRATEGVRGG